MKVYNAAKTASKFTVSKTDDKDSMVKKNYDKTWKVMKFFHFK